ncbi:MAG TPA: LysM domain-containing protein, partial [Aliiroseovarius sp.]|nr:LysM domain-containing protein [Aliiroseovarius sp.]
MGGAMLALAGCATSPFDVDFRNLVGGGLNFSGGSQERLVADRPEPDSRGIISYPSYQVAVAQRGDTLTTLAQRIGLAPAELARFNGLPVTAPLREGELIVLPGRV